MARVEITVQAVKKTTPYAKEELLLTSNHHNQNDAGVCVVQGALQQSN